MENCEFLSQNIIQVKHTERTQLYRKVFDGQLQENKFQFVLPQPYWKQALEACHDNMGHLGIERTTSLLRDHFYWPSILEDKEKHIKSCPRISDLKSNLRKLS